MQDKCRLCVAADSEVAERYTRAAKEAKQMWPGAIGEHLHDVLTAAAHNVRHGKYDNGDASEVAKHVHRLAETAVPAS